MHQKQRLKNLDRFVSDPAALLIASDVAARGLDINNVQHVIHYQVPKTSEVWIEMSFLSESYKACIISLRFRAMSTAADGQLERVRRA